MELMTVHLSATTANR